MKKQKRFEIGDFLKTRITGMHPEIIISDAPPTKWQIFFYKVNPFKRFFNNKERERVYKWYLSSKEGRL